jgi:bacterioferritin-associated ferredoxin
MKNVAPERRALRDSINYGIDSWLEKEEDTKIVCGVGSKCGTCELNLFS